MFNKIHGGHQSVALKKINAQTQRNHRLATRDAIFIGSQVVTIGCRGQIETVFVKSQDRWV